MFMTIYNTVITKGIFLVRSNDLAFIGKQFYWWLFIVLTELH